MYFALKSVRFDRDYEKGESIPQAVIDPIMIRRLVKYGVIRMSQKDQTMGKTDGKQKNRENNHQKSLSKIYKNGQTTNL